MLVCVPRSGAPDCRWPRQPGVLAGLGVKPVGDYVRGCVSHESNAGRPASPGRVCRAQIRRNQLVIALAATITSVRCRSVGRTSDYTARLLRTFLFPAYDNAVRSHPSWPANVLSGFRVILR